jgi:hypothetical protein
MMVTEIPTEGELLGLEDNSFQPGTPDVDDSMDMDEQLMYVALFAVLATLYNDFEHKSVDYILLKFPEAVTKAGEKLAKNSKTELTKLIEDHKVTVLKDYNIHEKVIPQVKLDYNLKGTFDTMESSVKSTINQLKDDVRTKALATKEKMAEAKNFNLKSNFQRAAKRTKNYVKFNAQFAKQKVTRSAQEMRYGSAMLYYWVVRGINTCQKCYDRARLPAQTIDQWPYDHPNGHCRLVPVSDDSTKEYQGYLALSQEYADISLI